MSSTEPPRTLGFWGCLGLSGALGCALLLCASAGHAAAPKRSAAIDALVAKLSSGDPSAVGAALDTLGQRSDRAAVDVLARFVRVGQPDGWADRGIEALGKTRSADARPVLAELAHHRRAQARRLAYLGIAAIAGEDSDRLLMEGLRDSDADVRAACATQLGERHAVAAVDLLMRALERSVFEAAPAIGKLGDAAVVTRFHGLLERLPLDVLLQGYAQFLARRDLPEASQLEIVAKLGEVASAPVKQFLEQQLAERVGAQRPNLTHAMRETAKRIDPRPATAPAPRSQPGKAKP